jgi:hypothetical protein
VNSAQFPPHAASRKFREAQQRATGSMEDGVPSFDGNKRADCFSVGKLNKTLKVSKAFYMHSGLSTVNCAVPAYSTVHISLCMRHVLIVIIAR